MVDRDAKLIYETRALIVREQARFYFMYKKLVLRHLLLALKVARLIGPKNSAFVVQTISILQGLIPQIVEHELVAPLHTLNSFSLTFERSK